MKIYLLGTFHLEYGDEELTDIDSPRMQELLAWILLNRDAPQSRQYLSFLFWPDSSEKQALTNLRQLLHHLRNNLPDAERLLKIKSKTLQWNKDSNFILDTAEFDHFFNIAEEYEKKGNTILQESSLVQAEELYKGELLTTCYEEWIAPERERLKQAYVKVLETLIKLFESKRDYTSALSYAKKLLQCDLFRESAYRALMHLYALNGDKAKALQTYERCTEVLEEELGISPGSQTEALYQRIRESNPVETEKESAKEVAFQVEDWPLVGRQDEWETLLTCWKEALRGNMQGVFISGDPGIGKTRLARELLSYVTRQGYTTGYTKTYEAAGTLSYGPVTDWLRQEPMCKQLANLDIHCITELVRLLPELLAEYPDMTHPGPIQEPWQQKQFLEAISRSVLGNRKPRLLVLDDLQWCDSETLAWLEHLFHFDPKAKLLVVGMLRPAEAPANESLKKLASGLRREQCLLELSLAELNETQTVELVSTIAEHKIDKETGYHLYQETEGNPLFVVESVREGKLMDGRGQDTSPFLSTSHKSNGIPARVKEVILARFEHLSKNARELMELAATIGREFNFKVLAAACKNDESQVVDTLDELLQQQIIRELHSEAYDFSHDKLREIAYLEMSIARKQLFHKQIAEAVETVFSETPDQYFSRLGFHYDRSGNAEKAIAYYDEAARVARDILANNEAMAYLNRALELLKTLGEGEKRDRLECNLQTNLSLSLVHQGYGAAEVFESCYRIRHLDTKLGESSQAPVLRILAIGNIVVGRFDEAHNLGLQLYHQAKKTGDPIEQVEACYVLGVSLHWQGKFTGAKKYLQEGIDHYRPNLHQDHIRRFGQNPMVICKIRLAAVLWILGDTEHAERLENEALDQATELSHPFSLAYVLHWSSWIQNLKGNVQQTLKMGEQFLLNPNFHQFPFWQPMGEVIYGWALARQGHVKRGTQLMRDGIEHYKESETVVYRPYFSCLMAEVLAEQGLFDEAFSLADDGINLMNTTGERWVEPEIYRIRGEIVLKAESSQTADAGAWFSKALEVARQQGAKSFEKRASESLKNLISVRMD